MAACATVNLNHHEAVTKAAQATTDWHGLPEQAESHGLSPLAYAHLQAAQIALPQAVKRELQGLHLRHKHAAKVRHEALQEMLTAFEQAGIKAVFLKGIALSYLVYPQPYLRLMRDIDLLVPEGQARQAQQCLADLGFKAPVPAAHAPLPDKHLEPATRQAHGMGLSVEVHHNLFNAAHPHSMTFERVTAPLQPFQIGNLTAHTLGHADMLWHLCQHVAYHANVWEPVRLVWVADIMGFVTRYATDIDWQSIATQYPLVLKTVSLMHCLHPLPDETLAHIPIKVGHIPSGIGEDFYGWPRASFGAQWEKGLRRILQDTFFPSEWWLRLHYTLDGVEPIGWYRWLKHPSYVLGWVGQFLGEQLRKRLP